MATPESKVKDQIKRALEAEGLVPFTDFVTKRVTQDVAGFYYMPVAGRFSVLGVHDFVGCWHGAFFSIETKAPGNTKDATFHQACFKQAVDVSGGIAVVGARGAEAVQEVKKLVLQRRTQATEV
jgi:hypothetical protein